MTNGSIGNYRSGSRSALANWYQLEVGSMIPPFSLPSIDGGRLSAQDFKAKRNLIILVFDPGRVGDLDVLWEFGRRRNGFAAENAETIGIANCSSEELLASLGEINLPVRLLYDDSPCESNTPLHHHAYVFVADRFGEIRMKSAVSPQTVDSVFDRATSVLGLIELECPECGAPTWSL